jgi:hypothetical protein
MPDLLHTWQDAARTLGGELDYADDRTERGREERVALRVRHRHWRVDFDVRAHTPADAKETEAVTRLRCAVANPDRFRFNCYEERFQHRLFKIMGLQDIVVGDPLLDRRFIIQASHEDRIRALFGLASVRAALASPHVAHLRLIDDEPDAESPLPPGVDLLYGRSERRMDRAEELLAHFQLFCATLDGLLELGFIRPDGAASATA